MICPRFGENPLRLLWLVAAVGEVQALAVILVPAYPAAARWQMLCKVIASPYDLVLAHPEQLFEVARVRYRRVVEGVVHL